MDIKANINYALEGRFKVDIFDKEGKLIETTDWFNNFITPTGLSYIYNYNFVDCFRYLSLGSNSGPNYGNKTGTGPGTTGLGTPIAEITTNLDSTAISGRVGTVFGTNKLSGQYIGPWAYQEGGCGLTEDINGPRYYRSWNIPFYDGVLASDLPINEFMVSPANGANSTGRYAFSRVTKPVIIPANTSSIISYELRIRLVSNSIQYFGAGTFQTGNAEVTNEQQQVSEWNRLSGYYRQTYHGLSWMDQVGQGFVPDCGNIMEPAFTGFNNCKFYLSPDNSAFDTSLSGGMATGEAEAYAADGLAQFVVEKPYDQSIDTAEPQNRVVKDTNSTKVSSIIKNLYKNIRLKASTAPTTKWPSLFAYNQTNTNDTDYRNITAYDFSNYSTATPGATGYYNDAYQFGNQAIFSTRGFNLPPTGTDFTSRQRKLVRKHSFLPSKSLGKNSRYGSLIYAYQSAASISAANFYPMIDCMFFDSSGQHTMAHYREITGIYFTNRGSGIVECTAYTDPVLDKPFIHQTFQGPGTGNLNNHPALGT